MIDWAVSLWNKNKSKLRERLAHTKQSEYDSYDKLFKMVIDEVFNDEDYLEREPYYPISKDDMICVDYGDYQGTIILIFHEKTYQPDETETYYIPIAYGSCSGCDTLLKISQYDEDIPSEQQVADYMMLCLHMVQNMHTFEEEVEDE